MSIGQRKALRAGPPPGRETFEARGPKVMSLSGTSPCVFSSMVASWGPSHRRGTSGRQGGKENGVAASSAQQRDYAKGAPALPWGNGWTQAQTSRDSGLCRMGRIMTKKSLTHRVNTVCLTRRVRRVNGKFHVFLHKDPRQGKPDHRAHQDGGTYAIRTCAKHHEDQK
jgi:hypothetical protein